MEKRLQGKIALITGGSRGIGAAIARRLAKEGCHIAISYSASKEKADALVNELQKENIQALALHADQANRKQVEELVQKVGKHFGRIDILVNNAGVLAMGAIDDPHLDLEGMANQHAVNIEGVFSTTHAAVPFMKSGARIITIGSIAAERMTDTGGANYAASKAALVGYTRGWARDLGPKNITVNLVQPGHTNTDMNPEDAEYAKNAKKIIPLGRYATPEDIASGVAFLASPDAAYITGTTLNIDGGFLA